MAGSILVVFSIFVTLGVAVYLYHEFRRFKRHHQFTDSGQALEEGQREFEVESDTDTGKRLIQRISDDNFFIDEEEEIDQ